MNPVLDLCLSLYNGSRFVFSGVVGEVRILNFLVAYGFNFKIMVLKNPFIFGLIPREKVSQNNYSFNNVVEIWLSEKYNRNYCTP